MACYGGAPMIPRAALLAALACLLLAVSASAQLRYVSDRGVATVGKVRCPAPERCLLRGPSWVNAKIGARSFGLRVLAPARIGAGRKALVRVRFGGRALAELAGRTTTVKVPVALRSKGKTNRRVLKLRIRRAALAGQPGGPGSPPASGPLGGEPPLLARTAGAVDVSSVQVTWYPRDSWIDYLVSTTFSNGAAGVDSLQSPCPDKPRSNPESGGEPYAVQMLAKPSWFDPGLGIGAIYGQGSVHFRYPGHGIDLTASDPEVEINGAASRLILRLSGAGNSAVASQRVVFAGLGLAGQPSKAESGAYGYELMRANLAADSAAAFSTFYSPGTPWGCVSVSFTTP